MTCPLGSLSRHCGFKKLCLYTLLLQVNVLKPVGRGFWGSISFTISPWNFSVKSGFVRVKFILLWLISCKFQLILALSAVNNSVLYRVRWLILKYNFSTYHYASFCWYCWEMLISRSHRKQLLVRILLNATRQRAALLAVTSSNQTTDLNTDGCQSHVSW